MSLRSVWTIQAEAAYSALLVYLELEWGTMVADAFEPDIAYTIALLEVFPDADVMERHTEQLRSIPVARQVRLFYRHTDKMVIVLEFIDTRSARFQDMR